LKLLKTKYLLALMVPIIFVCGCGYKLRTWDLSENIDTIFVSSNSASPIFDPLADALGQAGVQVIAVAGDADLAVRLGQYVRTRRTASVNRRASAADYQLSLRVTYEIFEGGERILGPQAARAYRVYRVDRDNIVGSSEEEALLETEMKVDLVQQIVRAINAVTKEKD